MATKCCKTCWHLKLPEPDKDGKVRLRKSGRYFCQFDHGHLLGALIEKMPSSVIRYYSFRQNINSLLQRQWVEIDCGTDCPQWMKREGDNIAD